jgi:hypothetical protein
LALQGIWGGLVEDLCVSGDGCLHDIGLFSRLLCFDNALKGILQGNLLGMQDLHMGNDLGSMLQGRNVSSFFVVLKDSSLAGFGFGTAGGRASGSQATQYGDCSSKYNTSAGT